MPIYEYRCSSCGFQKEHMQKMSDALLTVCPECGKETYAKLKALDPCIRIIVSTGYSSKGFEFSDAGESAKAFLQKPYQLEELSRTMRDVLDKNRSQIKV